MTPQLEKIYADKGFVVLNWADGGWVHFFTKSPMRTPDELKGMKLFTWGGDTPTVEIWKAAGFNPVPLPVDRDLDGAADRAGQRAADDAAGRGAAAVVQPREVHDRPATGRCCWAAW